jgi:hypothetical protein
LPGYTPALLGTASTHTGGPLALLRLLPAASFIEWRYIAMLAPGFHGIVGASLVNPFGLFGNLAESGLLFIVAGVVDAPHWRAQSHQHSANNGAYGAANLQEICHMHLFPTACLHFGGADATTLEATHEGVTLRMAQHTPQHGVVQCDWHGLHIELEHSGLEGVHLAPCFADDLRLTPQAHWIVYNPSPIARVSGKIAFEQGSLAHLPQRTAQHYPDFVSAALAQRVAERSHTIHLDHANGYYEHSFGINPLPLHGWDFLFVPDAERRQGLVLQTYPRSRTLRYVEVFWYADGEQKYTRFSAEHMQLRWRDRRLHPEMQVSLPGQRTITAFNGAFHLEVENTIPHRIPFLRPQSFAVRHFFIAEEIGLTTWRLKDTSGRVLAEAIQQPSGGEVAHVRLSGSAPRKRVGI